MIERTLVLIKQDALLQRMGAGFIIRALDDDHGLMRIAMKQVMTEPKVVQEHYKHLSKEPFFEDLLEFMDGPVVAMVYEGEDAVQKVRRVVGTIRKDTEGTSRNPLHTTAHASDSRGAALREIPLWFNEREFCDMRSPSQRK